ncbi:MAG: DeoR/GlpR transcriptional regulator [Spirochaetaceae bacterium]|nr:MAG: DeoR/GlpR transcriptional regulator [Spirochaetaceae bacterium]
MLPYERQELILEALNKERFLKIKELLDLTNSSLTTLRRDINYLSESGKIRKSRGGILLVEQREREEASFLYRDREKLYKTEKERIGRAAQRYIEDRDFIFLLNGTTTISVARNLFSDKQITIITNGIDIVSALRDRPNVEVILLGGIVDYPNYVMTGPMVLKELDDLHATKLISGAGGITEEKGITIYPYMVSAYYQKIVDMVERVIIVADHSKFGRNALVQATALDNVDTIITDEAVPEKYLQLLRQKQIETIIS